jgi:hypothetical protein
MAERMEALRLGEAAALQRADAVQAALTALGTEHRALRANADASATAQARSLQGLETRVGALSAELDAARARADGLASQAAAYASLKEEADRMVRWGERGFRGERAC